MYPNNAILIALGDDDDADMSVVAKNMVAAPNMCIAAKTRWAAKYRSAIIPTINGEMIPAIGPAAYVHPMSSPEKPIVPR